MEEIDAEIINLLDIALPEEQLDQKIYDTQCLNSLIVLLELKRRRILNGKIQKMCYPVHKIYERETEDINLQCEALKRIFLIIKNPDKAILQVIIYLNLQLDRVNNSFKSHIAAKIALLLNEIILICKIQRKEHIFLEKVSLDYINRLLFNIFQSQNSFKICILSTVLPNYINILDELHQLSFLNSYFLQCEDVHNLDVLCIFFNYVDKKALLINCQSILFLDDFWKYVENCISSNIAGQQKQAVYLLKRCIQEFFDSDVFKCEVPYLQIANVSAVQETPKKLWQNFFILLDASKEKQLHLIWPSMTLLDSLKYINSLWQICIYKKLLAHTQNAVVYFVASHILQNKIFFPTLNKYFLSAINKNEYMYYSTNMFKELPNFCNSLNLDDYFLFVKDISEITWIPTAAWCFFSNMFTESTKKTIPFKVFEPIYRLLKQLPHVYIRNGCISIFLNYFVRNYNWEDNFDDVLKLLSIVKHRNNNLFITTVSNRININYLNSVLLSIEDSVLDIKEFEVFVEIIKILKYETGIQTILKLIQKFDNKFQAIIYANLFEKFNKNDVVKFILEQTTELDNNCAEMILMIIKKIQAFPDFNEIVNSKMLYILQKSSDFNKSIVSIALNVTLNSYKSNKFVINKEVVRDLKSRFFEYGKTDDGLCVIFLELYFLTEEYPEVTFLDDILHNQSDIVISKMFECLSEINFHTNDVNIIYFLEEAFTALLNLTKSKHFKSIILNYINCIFSASFLQTVYENKRYSVIVEVTESLLSLSETFPIMDYYMSEKIKNTVRSPGFSEEYFCILIYALQGLLLKGIVIKKDDRVDYCVCQEVNEKLGNAMENPNFNKISTRMSSVESILQIISENPEHADVITINLVSKYRTHFNKRYFPDSQIHLQKLRIVQALLTIYPFIKSQRQRQTLIDLIEESFCTEIHQPCVKQLMQWLLLSLIKDQNDDYFNSIKVKIDTASKTQPSTIVAFIVVLLHLTLNKEELYWFSAVEALIPWSMGAHFKLRVYSQAAIKKLLEEGKQRHYENFVKKFSYLEKSIISVIKASGNAFYETLKSDELIFSIFEPDKYYSLETIYVDIPKLNGVTRTEWENVLNYKFICHTRINTFNENRSFSNYVTRSIENNMKGTPSEDLCENTYNIQRKIDPWKNITEEQRNGKQISDFILIASLIDKSTNLGGLSRTCEVFGVKQLTLNDIKILNDKEFKSLSMSSEEWVNTIEVKTSDLKKFICEIRKGGYSVIGAEQTSDSVCLDKYKFNKKTALVLGNEKEGIPPDIIPILDACIEIPQFGMVRSLNVHVAGATFIWEYAKQHLIK